MSPVHATLPNISQRASVVGCTFSDKIIYPETMSGNPDFGDSVYSTEYGVYQPHCGLENVMLSWGHDEV
jgi:inositol oxygenase